MEVGVQDTNRIWCQPESAMFCEHLFQNWYTVQLLQGWDLFYRRYDEDMDNPLLILTLFMISS